MVKKIEICLYGLNYKNYNIAPEMICLDIYLIHSQNNAISKYNMILSFETHNKDHAEKRIKRIIKNLDEIITFSLKEQEYIGYFDYSIQNMTMLSDEGLMLDLSEDEIKIIDNRVLQ
jgi:hypothetical protein